MKIFNSLEEVRDIESTVIALGNFDGVHRGHQEIIKRTVKSAEAAGLKRSANSKALLSPFRITRGLC